MFLVIVQKQQQYVTGHASFWAVSSNTSDRLLKRPDDHVFSCKPVRRYHQLMVNEDVIEAVQVVEQPYHSKGRSATAVVLH